MLLHATIHWPEQNHLDLWPFTIVHAIFIWNHMPKHATGLGPIELFSQMKLALLSFGQEPHFRLPHLHLGSQLQ